VGRYSVSRVCRELRLNASRLVQKGGRTRDGVEGARGADGGIRFETVELPALGASVVAAPEETEGCRVTVESAGSRVVVTMGRGTTVEISCHSVLEAPAPVSSTAR
jgi:hypothetical protein